jgi:hypothetical protein
MARLLLFAFFSYGMVVLFCTSIGRDYRTCIFCRLHPAGVLYLYMYYSIAIYDF